MLVTKLSRHIELSERDKAALRLCTDTEVRTIPPDTTLVRQAEPYPNAYVIHDGWAIRERYLPDGRRQIMNFLLDGDGFGFAGALLGRADHIVSSLTEMHYSRINANRLIAVIGSRPAVGAALISSIAVEEAVLRERIVSLGRRSAREHLAHILVELVQRRRNAGNAETEAARMPLNQVQLSDALGISPVHANRTIRRFVTEGLLRTGSREIVIRDEAALRAISGFEEERFQQFPGHPHRMYAAEKPDDPEP